MIGIMSDSHDNVDAVRLAVGLFNRSACELVLHAGDFVAPFAARELKSLACPVKAVFGNCDGERAGLERIIREFGEIKAEPFIFRHANLNLLLTHVHFSNARYAASGKYDVIVCGHTHRPGVRTKNKTLIINPGEAGGWVTGKKTVALLDPETKTADIVFL